MTLLGMFGIILGLLALPVAFVERTPARTAMLLAAYALHLAASLTYYYLSLTEIGDTYGYYYDPWDQYSQGFGMGTEFLIYVVQSIKRTTGGTFLDFFLLFQWIGFVGIALLMRILDETCREIGTSMPFYFYAILFIPSLHYWSGAFGKDTPYLFAITAAVWASMHLGRRLPVLIIAILLMLLIRPHIAVIAAAALALTLLSGRGVALHTRSGLSVLSIAGLYVSAIALQATYNIDLASVESINQQFQRIDAVLDTGDAGSTAVDASFPVRLLSLMFRPLFFDADDAFGLIASAESVGLVVLTVLLLWRAFTIVSIAKSVTHFRFALILTVGLILFLALSYFNVGLGLRQKWTMVVPPFLIVFATLQGIRKARADAVRQAPLSSTSLAYSIRSSP